MSAATVAAEAATTDWRTYDGGALPDFLGVIVFLPVAMAFLLVLPAALCFCCLPRRRLVPYTAPNMVGGYGLDRKNPYNGSVNHGSVAEK